MENGNVKRILNAHAVQRPTEPSHSEKAFCRIQEHINYSISTECSELQLPGAITLWAMLK